MKKKRVKTVHKRPTKRSVGDYSAVLWFGALLVVIGGVFLFSSYEAPVGQAFGYSKDITMTKPTRTLDGGRWATLPQQLLQYFDGSLQDHQEVVNSLSELVQNEYVTDQKIESVLLDDSYLIQNNYVDSEGAVPVILLASDIGVLKGNAHFTKVSDLPLINGVFGLMKKSGIVWAKDNTNIIGVRLDHTLSIPEPKPGGPPHQRDVVRAGEANAQGLDGSGIIVAVLDTGIDTDHPDLVGKVIREQSFISGESPYDGHGHGTHVAGIIAGSGAASNGNFKGIAPGVQLINGKVLSNSGSGSTSGIIEGMQWALNNGADIISMSLGGSTSEGVHDPLSIAANAVANRGVVVVIAAGNDGN